METAFSIIDFVLFAAQVLLLAGLVFIFVLFCIYYWQIWKYVREERDRKVKYTTKKTK